MEKLKEFLKRVVGKASSSTMKKSLTYDVEIIGNFKNYLWRTKSEQVEIRAVLFRIKKDEKYHNVVLAVKDSTWYLWCGDKWFQDEEGLHEEFCFQMKDRTKVCHHMLTAVRELQTNPDLMADVEGFLNPDVFTSPKVQFDTDEFSLAYEMKLPMLLYGVTGAGKSYSVLEFVKKVQAENPVSGFFQINMSSGLEDIDLLAKMIPDPSGKWSIRDGELWKAFKSAQKKPVIILIEELTRSTKSARNLFLKAMDSVNGSYKLQNFVTGEEIEVPTDNIWWVATANIGYSDTEEVDPALMRRFLITKFVDYDLEKEKQIVAEILGDEADAEKIIEKVVKPIRKAYETGQIPYPIDTGTLKVFATLYKKTGNLMKSAQMTFMYRIVDVDSSGKPSEEQLQLLRDIIDAY